MPSRDSLRKEEKHLENTENNSCLGDISLKSRPRQTLFSQSSEVVYKYVPGYSLYLWTGWVHRKKEQKISCKRGGLTCATELMMSPDA